MLWSRRTCRNGFILPVQEQSLPVYYAVIGGVLLRFAFSAFGSVGGNVLQSLHTHPRRVVYEEQPKAVEAYTCGNGLRRLLRILACT